MVRPLPEAAALLACEVSDFGLAEKLLAGLVRSPVRPVAVELSAGRGRDGNPLFGPVAEGKVARLYVGFEGSPAEVQWMLGQLREEWAALGMTSPVLITNLAEDRLWRWIAEFLADARVGVLPSKTVPTIVELLRIAPDCSIHAHAGDGLIRISGINNSNTNSSSREPTAPGEVARDSAFHREPLAPGYCDDDAATGYLSPEIRVMRAIKERFDPKNILVPDDLRTADA
jgi:FAD/FMN-containing dehydrogenase